MCMSKLIQLCTLNICSFLYVSYTTNTEAKTAKSVLRGSHSIHNAYIRKGSYQISDLSFYLMKLGKEKIKFKLAEEQK